MNEYSLAKVQLNSLQIRQFVDATTVLLLRVKYASLQSFPVNLQYISNYPKTMSLEHLLLSCIVLRSNTGSFVHMFQLIEHSP